MERKEQLRRDELEREHQEKRAELEKELQAQRAEAVYQLDVQENQAGPFGGTSCRNFISRWLRSGRIVCDAGDANEVSWMAEIEIRLECAQALVKAMQDITGFDVKTLEEKLCGDDARECMICLETIDAPLTRGSSAHRPRAMLYPCRHMKICLPCANKVWEEGKVATPANCTRARLRENDQASNAKCPVCREKLSRPPETWFFGYM